LAISALIPSWLDEVTDTYSNDPKAQELLTKLAVSPIAQPYYSLQQGLIRHNGHIWVGADNTLQQRLIEAFHSSAVGDHSGFPATYQCIR
jgi:hypothetical protein